MTAENKPLVKAQGGQPAPQYFNTRTQQYEVITGSYGANSFIERGRLVKDVFSGSTTVTKVYGTNMYGLGIVNDGQSDLTVTINMFDIVVKPNESFDDLFDPFQRVTIEATDSFRAVIRE